MYHLEFHDLETRIAKLINLIEIFKFGYVTNHKHKLQYKTDIHTFVESEYEAFSDLNLRHMSLFHYNYYLFLSDQIKQPIDELTVGNTPKHIDAIQQRLLRIHQQLLYFL
ncbi:hypothetical protein [Staphylococcus caeli]|uniref:hypothetical protein n=1 Tax=Staphylococcus caeli TaxID=2201815 RepID=UPI003F543B5D